MGIRDLYPIGVNGGSSILNPWGRVSASGESDVRQELHETVFGSISEVAKGRKGIFRRMRRDHNGDLVKCSCVDEITLEPDRDHFCPYCWGEGYLFDEEWVVYYKMQIASNEGFMRKDRPFKGGIVNTPYVFFYVEYNVNPTRFDKIIEMERDLDGNLVVPYKREAIYTIATAEDFRADNGRVEYWRLAATKDSVSSTYLNNNDS
jgi:hypothetical protein